MSTVSSLIRDHNNLILSQAPDENIVKENGKEQRVVQKALKPGEKSLLERHQRKYSRKYGSAYDSFLDTQRQYVYGEHKPVVKSKNLVREKDLDRAIALGRSTLDSSRFQGTASAHGLEAQEKNIKIKATTDEGVCFASVIYFLKTAHETGSGRLAAQKFNDGMPLEAIKNQHIYKNFDISANSKKVGKLIIKMIQSGEKEKYIDKLRQHGNNYEWLYQVMEYLIQSNKITDQEEVEKYKKAMNTQELRDAFEIIYSHFTDGLKSYQKKRISFTLDVAADLKIVKGLSKSDSLSVARALSKAKGGLYLIVLPTYDSSGVKNGGHALGLVVDKEGSHFFDPNLGAVRIESDKSELGGIAARNFTIYGGKDISELGAVAQQAAILKSMDQNPFFLYKVGPK